MIWLAVLCFLMVILTKCVDGKTMAKILIGLGGIGAVVLFFSYYTIQVVPK